MAYTRLHWVESETPLSAQNMNNIEDGIEELKSQKVDKVSGKALSDQNYTAAEKTKLAGIEEGAEVNVQSDWNQTNTSADDYIQNKPVNATTSSDGFMSASDKSKLDGVQAGAQVNRTYTAVTGKPTAAASPGFGGTVTVSQVAQSATGQVSVTDRVITIPSSDATTSTHGLMTAADKTKLNGIATGATKTPNIKVQNSTVTDNILNIVFSAPLTVTKEQTATTGSSTTKETIGVSNATTSANGLMSSADKAKLDGVETGATKNTISSVTLSLGKSKTLAAKSSTTLEFKGDFPTLCAVKSIGFTKSNGQVTNDVAICGFYVGTSGSQTSVSVQVFNNLSENIVLHETYTRVKLICFS